MCLRYALIGCGRISPNHLAAAEENGLEIVAICDLLPEMMEDKSQKIRLPKAVKRYQDYREMLATERPELVAIATESGNHAAIALDCMDYGCNLIIEKPIALSLRDADEIIQKAKATGVTVSACHQNRFNKAVQKLRQAVEGGRFGRLLHGAAHIRWSRGEDYYKQAPWRGTWAQDGGALMNQCIHNIDLLRWMMGDEVVEVVGMTDNLNHPYIEAEDVGMAVIRFGNGSYGLLEGTTNVYPNNLEETLYLFGKKGTAKLGGKSVNVVEKWMFADGQDEESEIIQQYSEDPPTIYGYGHGPLYKDVIESIQQGRDPYVTAEDGKRALELVLAIYEAAATGTTVKWPLKDLSTLQYQGLFAR